MSLLFYADVQILPETEERWPEQVLAACTFFNGVWSSEYAKDLARSEGVYVYTRTTELFDVLY